MAPGAVRRRLWYAFAALWSVDALLKLQPQMFSPSLFVNVLGPVAADVQPAWLAAVLAATNGLWVHHMVLGDAAVFAVEAAIAALLWTGWERRAGRAGLWLAVVWSLAVWVAGEGMGGLIAGDASWLAEAPGATVVYAAIAAVLLVPAASWRSGGLARAVRHGLGLFWLAGALVQLAGPFWTGAGLGAVFGDVTMNGQQPVMVERIINAVLSSVVSHPVPWNAALAGGMVVLAALYAARGTGAWPLAASLVWLAFVWVTSEAFGNLGTGTATDPGQAVPLALLAWTAAALGRERRQAEAPALAGVVRRWRVAAAGGPQVAPAGAREEA